MAAPSFYSAITGATDAGGAWSFDISSASFSAAPSVGDVCIIQILQDGATNGAVALTTLTNSGLENLAGTANAVTQITGPNGDGSWPIGGSSEARQFLWIGRWRTTGAGFTISGTNSTSEDLYYRAYAFKTVSTGTTLATVIEETTAGNASNGAGTAASVTDTSVTTLGPDRLALNFVGINDDNAISAFTGETGGDWTEAVAEYAESSGTDASIGLQASSLGADFKLLQETTGTQLGIGNVVTNKYVAWSFSLAGTATVTSVEISLPAPDGNPSDDLLVEIRTDTAGAPSTTVLGSATLTDAAIVTGWNVAAISGVSLTGGTTYWLTVSRTGAVDGVNARAWERAGSSVLPGSAVISGDGSSWSSPVNPTFDQAVRIWTANAAATINGGAFTQADGTDGWGVVGFALIGTTVVLDQQHYRFRNDDGNETTATWLADLDTDVN